MNLLIAGGAGFIGANFAHLLRARGHTALVLDALTYAGDRKHLADLRESKVKLVVGDICDSHRLDEIFGMGFRGMPFDAVVNFAAETHVDRSINDGLPFVWTNVTGAAQLLDTARAFEVPIFLQVSTDEVYGSIEGEGAFVTEAKLDPTSPYASSKAGADLIALSYYKTHGYDVRISRCTNNYGRFQHREKFIPTIIHAALEGKPIPIYGDGRQVRNWIYVEDHCEGLLRVLEQGKPGSIYHFGGPRSEEEVTNLELVEIILRLLCERTGRPLQEYRGLIQHVGDRPAHDRRYALDWSDTERELGWAPKVSLEEGLRQTIDWYLTADSGSGK